MALALRQPIPSDYEDIASWISDANACARWAGPQLRFPFSATELPELLAGETATSFSLVDSSTVLLGFGQLVRQNPSVLRFARIIVAPHKRRLGVGTSLCKLLLAEVAIDPAIERVTLRVYRDNPSAIALYSKLGFGEGASHPRPEIMTMERDLSHG